MVDVSAVADRYANASDETRYLVDRLLTEDADDQAWVDQLGPAYRQADVARLLRKSKQAVSADGRLLKLEMRGGGLGYPVFQFDGRRQLSGICDVVAILGPVVATPWTTASWLTSSNGDLGGSRPLDVLRDGRIDDVIAVARRVAHAMVA